MDSIDPEVLTGALVPWGPGGDKSTTDVNIQKSLRSSDMMIFPCKIYCLEIHSFIYSLMLLSQR